MKKLFNIMFLCATYLLIFSSCSKDDDISITKEQVVGTWDVIWAEQDGEIQTIHTKLLCLKIIT